MQLIEKPKKEPKYWVGLDISKLSINYAIMKTIDEKNFSHCKFENGKISNDLEGFANMERILRKFPVSKIGLICETTGVYGIPFCNYFYKRNYCVVEEHAKRIKYFARTFCNKGKTDKLDAQLICYYGHLTEPEPKFSKFDEVLELERKVKLRNMLKKQAHQFGGLTEAFEFPYHAVGFELNEHAPASILLNRQLVAETQVNLKAMDKEVNDYVKLKFKQVYENLLTIPQIGEVTAATIIVNTLNFNRFKNVNQFINYCGLVPRPYESGSSVGGGVRTIPNNYNCDSELRVALYNAVSGAVGNTLKNGKCKNKGLQSVYNALPDHIKALSKTGSHIHHKHICIVLSRKLAKQVFVCGKYNKKYEPNPAKAIHLHTNTPNRCKNFN